MDPRFLMLSRARTRTRDIDETLTLALFVEDQRDYWERSARASLHDLALELGYELKEIRTDG